MEFVSLQLECFLRDLRIVKKKAACFKMFLLTFLIYNYIAFSYILYFL
jgi:hypothetical protein